MSDHVWVSRLTTARWLLASLALGSATCVQAQEERSPYYIGVTQSFTHDSNVFRTASGQIADTTSGTGLIAGIDQQISRQRLYADGTVQVNRHRNVDQLNNTSYSLKAGLDWSTVEFLSGTLRYTTARNQANFGVVGVPAATGTNLETTQQFLASARYGLTSDLAFDVSAEHRSLKYSDEASANRNYTQNIGGAGLRWGKPSIFTFGIGGRLTKGTTPDYQPTDPKEDKLTRKDLDFTADWVPTGFSTLHARVSVTKETHTVATASDVDGQTGALEWAYKPTGKLSFSTTLSRDTGTETTFSIPSGDGSTAKRVDDNRITNTVLVAVKYELTSKISTGLNARQSKGKGGATTGDDKVNTYGLTATYEATRNFTLGCNYSHESRSTSGVGVDSYTVNLVGCTAQLALK